MEQRRKRIAITLPQKLQEKLDVYRAKTGMARSVVIAVAVEEFLRRRAAESEQ